MPEPIFDLVARISRRDSARSEATLQADIRAFILGSGLNLRDEQLHDVGEEVALEAQVGDGSRRRLDIETGCTVIEVKRNLERGSVKADAEKQLGGYMGQRVRQTGARFLGVLTDGANWHLYVPSAEDGSVIEAGAPLRISSGADADRLREWLGTILATVEHIRPSPAAIERHLGADSPAHAADHATLRALLEAAGNKSEVKLKRELWGKLLKTAFGQGFRDNEQLFIDHTLLVLTAEAIAHAVLGFDISKAGNLSPRALADGAEFAKAQIHGVVEADFFDWPLEVEGGSEFVRSLADRLSRFDWTFVDHDVLKHLYESVISQESREALGEYYTPDWLADRMVEASLPDPLSTRVLDASAGSGTFVFHAVRSYLQAAEGDGQTAGQAIAGLVNHVFGMDIHPVAVTLARVTYLLAIGQERLLAADRGPITVPVFLGDSLQWEQDSTLLSRADAISVSTSGDDLLSAGGGLLFDDDLVFPHSVLRDAQTFDRLVSDMADKVLSSVASEPTPTQRLRTRNRQLGATTSTVRELVDPILARHNVPDEDRDVLRQTFSTLRQLHLNGRDHIWGYYVRNLIRPIWFSMPENKMDLLVGNPPWLRFNKMSKSMQDRYKRLSQGRNLLSGRLGASSRDLSTLFVVRAVELYLKEGGRFSYVMPHGTMTRRPNDGFRSGRWNSDSKSGSFLTAEFDESWDLLRAPTGFPMTSCVISGTRTTAKPGRLPSKILRWEARFTDPGRPWAAVANKFTVTPGTIEQLDAEDAAPISPYKSRFRDGAILYPRMLMYVVDADAGPLGPGAGRIAVRSRRTRLEKKPWATVETIVATVGSEFIFDSHLGETLAPYRALEPLRCVLPIRDATLLSASAIAETASLASWWDRAEEGWAEHRVPSEKKSLAERIDFHNQLSAQIQTQHDIRVCYTKSGNSLAAAIVHDPSVIIDHKLYWAPATSLSEARYLLGILNSRVLLERVKPLQAVGLFGARDFDKNVFSVPFQAFDNSNPDHSQLVALVEEAEGIAASVDVGAAKRFQDARKAITTALARGGLLDRIEDTVNRILPVVSAESVEM